MTQEHATLLWRVAARIRATIESSGANTEPPELPWAAWRNCSRVWRLQRETRRRHWGHGEGAVRMRLKRTIEDCRRQLAATAEALTDVPLRIATTREIFEDLAALEKEFCRVTIELRETQLTVLTETIVLEGMSLGQFEVVLDWSRMTGRSMAYRIVAVSGASASADSDVSHPHVRDETLCEGEARSAIVAALWSGRLFDFYEVVVQTLSTYNAHSAFVELDRWHGASCADCGRSVDDEEGSSCERCECELCDDCAGGCQECGHSLCNECLGTCRGCQELHCSTCLTACRQCAQRFCERCQTDELCNACREEAVPVEAQPGPEAHPATAALDPVCLGQVGLPT